MSRSWEKCILCEEQTQTSDTNADLDLGFIVIHNKVICPDCLDEIRENLK